MKGCKESVAKAINATRVLKMAAENVKSAWMNGKATPWPTLPGGSVKPALRTLMWFGAGRVGSDERGTGHSFWWVLQLWLQAECSLWEFDHRVYTHVTAQLHPQFTCTKRTKGKKTDRKFTYRNLFAVGLLSMHPFSVPVQSRTVKTLDSSFSCEASASS